MGGPVQLFAGVADRASRAKVWGGFDKKERNDSRRVYYEWRPHASSLSTTRCIRARKIGGAFSEPKIWAKNRSWGARIQSCLPRRAARSSGRRRSDAVPWCGGRRFLGTSDEPLAHRGGWCGRGGAIHNHRGREALWSTPQGVKFCPLSKRSPPPTKRAARC